MRVNIQKKVWIRYGAKRGKWDRESGRDGTPIATPERQMKDSETGLRENRLKRMKT